MSAFNYEIDVTPGLEAIVADELSAARWARAVTVTTGSACLMLASDISLHHDLYLRTAIAGYLRLTFPVPRPKALLGHQYFTAIVQYCRDILAADTFATLSIGAAGRDSEVMQRFQTELATALNLQPVPETGDLHIRLRPNADSGWDVLVRLSPRPWATRSWRSHNMPGALTAPVANAMLRLLRLSPEASLLNVGSGSGTFLVEAQPMSSERVLHGCDLDAATLAITQSHLSAAGSKTPVQLVQADVRRLPYAPHSVAALISDLPFGQLIGTRDQLPVLYRSWLHSCADVIAIGGRCIFLTHAIKLMDEVLRDQRQWWRTERVVPITLNGLHPRIYLLTRRSDENS